VRIEIRWPFTFAEPKQAPPEGELAAAGESLYTRATEIWNTDDVIRTKGAAYVKSMPRKNGFLDGLLESREQTILGRGWDVTPASEGAVDVEIAAFVRAALDAMDGEFGEDLGDIYAAVKWGYSITEKIWRPWPDSPSGEKWTIGALHAKQWEQFRFQVDFAGNLAGLRQETPKSQLLPLEKFVVATYRPEPGNPYGRGTVPECYHHDWLMREGWSLWAMCLERFGMAFPVITMPPNPSQADKDAIDDILDTMQARTGIRLPAGMAFDLKQAVSAGKATYGEFVDEQKQNLQVKILGQTLTTTVDETGARSLGEVHARMKDELADKDTRWLYRNVNEQIVKPLVDVNFAGAAYPVVFTPIEDEIDVKSLTEMLVSLSGIGFRIPERWAHERVGIPEPAGDEPVLEAPRQTVVPGFDPNRDGGQAGLPIPPDDRQFAEPATGRSRKPSKRENARVVRAIERVSEDLFASVRDEARGIWEEIRDDLVAQVERSGALDEGRIDIELKPALGPWRDLAARVWMAAHLSGRWTAIAEIEAAGAGLTRKFGEEFGCPAESRARHFAEQAEIDVLIQAPSLDEARAWFGDRTAMSKAEWDRLAREARREAFYLTTREGSEAAGQVYDALKEALVNEWGVPEFRRAVESRFRVWVGDVFGSASASTIAQADARVATVLRTNVMGALNAGRDAVFARAEDPEYATDPIVAYEYSAIMDSRTRATHAAMDGKIFAKDDPIWLRWKPPAGYNCRCYRVPVLRSMAAKMRREDVATAAPVIDGVPVEPDKGFGRLAA
jgi:SPP1 gp7 family putative phage head morphogenesis protein